MCEAFFPFADSTQVRVLPLAASGHGWLGWTRSLRWIATMPETERRTKLTGLLRAIKEAMFEALDQRQLLAYPALESSPDLLLRKQQFLTETVGRATPVVAVDQIAGARRHHSAQSQHPKRQA